MPDFEGVLDIWGGGHLLAFSGVDGPTDFHQGLTLRSSFQNTGLEIKLPATARLVFDETAPQHTLLAGDFFRLVTSRGTVRGAFADAWHLLIEGPCQVLDLADGLLMAQRDGRTLVGSAKQFQPALLNADPDTLIAERSAWLRARKVPAKLSPGQRRAFYKACSQIKTMVYSAEGIIRRRFTTPDRWPHRGMWLWDSAFHAIGMRHLDIGLAREILEATFDGQAEDGRVPIRTDPGRRQMATQPPVLCLAASKLQECLPDRAWLERLYPRLCAYVQWDIHNRDSDGAGLVEWEIEGNPMCRSGESGMDNSPRFDSATRLDATDFNAFLARECELLAGFAKELGKPEDAVTWQAQHQRLCRLINERLWSNEKGFYLDFDVETGRPSPVMASSGFLPLLCGAASIDQLESLEQHLQAPESFGTPLPVPSIAAHQIEMYSKDMWRGPVWMNLNWLIAEGFARYGRTETSSRIRMQSMSEIEQCVDRYGTFFEFFDDRREVKPPLLMRKGSCAPESSPFHQVLFDFGWTATLYLDFLLSNRSPGE